MNASDNAILMPPPGTNCLSLDDVFSIDLNRWTEERLVAAAQQGSRRALDELLTRYRSEVFAVLLRYTRSRDEAEDLVQDVMLRVYQNITHFRRQSRFSSWIIAIGINAVRSAQRKARHSQWMSIDDESERGNGLLSRVLVDHRTNPEQAFMHRERSGLLRSKLRYLTPKYRIVLEQTDLAGIPIEATAAMLGLTPSAVKSRLHRARSRLRSMLEPSISGTGNRTTFCNETLPWQRVRNE